MKEPANLPVPLRPLPAKKPGRRIPIWAHATIRSSLSEATHARLAATYGIGPKTTPRGFFIDRLS